MPPRVATGGASFAASSGLAQPRSSQPLAVQLQPTAGEPAHSIETVFDTLNTCLLRINRQQVVTYANPIALRCLQTESDDIVGRKFNSVFHGLKADSLRDAIKGEIFTDCELRLVRFPDHLLHLHIHPDRHGAIVFFKGIAAQPRQATTQLLQASLNSLSAHVVILDRAGNIVASNLAWQRFVTANKLTEGPIDHRGNYLALCENGLLAFCPQALAIRKELVDVLSGNRPAMRQIYSWNGAKAARWFEIRASRLDCEREDHFVVVNTEVTAVKEAEQALGEAAETLLTVQEEERQRIAGELHDSTAQHLVAAELNLASLKSKIPASVETIEFLQRIENSLGEASKELRTLTYLLHPPSLDTTGLSETTRRYLEGFAKRTSVQTKLRIGRGVDALPSLLQRPIFRVIQEALANVHRHAAASHVSIGLRCMGGHLHVVIRDNGRGMGAIGQGHKLSEPSSPGVGIPGIRARLRQFGGRLVIKSGAGGTVLHTIVPICAEAARDSLGRHDRGSTIRTIRADGEKNAAVEPVDCWTAGKRG